MLLLLILVEMLLFMARWFGHLLLHIWVRHLLVLLNWLLVEVLLGLSSAPWLNNSLLLSRGLENHDVLILVQSLSDLTALHSNSIVIWPHSGQTLREEENTVDRDFERTDSGDDLEERLIWVFIWHKLTVDITHCEFLGHHVEDDVAARHLLLDGLGGIDSVGLVLVGIVPRVPRVGSTILAVFDDEDFAAHFLKRTI